MRRSHLRLIAAAAVVVTAAGAAIAVSASNDTSSQRQRQVAERGAQVMPFNLDATTHRFIERADGGDQIVVADNPEDRRQVQLIRQHLRKEARAFARGDFNDPAAIHGSEMPGLASLRNAGNNLAVEVENRSDGARLTFRTTDPDVRDALHDWFDAQVTDHGRHASAG
jgi:hypothetical protein